MPPRTRIGFLFAALALVVGLAVYLSRGVGEQSAAHPAPTETTGAVDEDPSVASGPALVQPATLSPHESVDVGTVGKLGTRADALLVHVVDSTGAPRAGVRTSLLCRRVDQPPLDPLEPVWHGLSKQLSRGVTDERGLVSLGLRPAREESVRAEITCVVRARLLLTDPVIEELVGLPKAGDRLTLVVPPTGSLLVRLVDHGGQPVFATARLDAGLGPEVPEFFDVIESPRMLKGQVMSGTALLDEVGLDSDVWLRATLDRDPEARAEAVVQGPRRSGETVEVELKLPRPPPALTGVLVDEAGSSLSAMSLTLRVRDAAGEFLLRRSGPDSSLGGARTGPVLRGPSTDEGGRFEASSPRLAQLSGSAVLHLELGVSGVLRAGGREARAGSIALPASMGAGTVDLGEIELHSLPLLIGGVVQDEEGLPIVAHVEVGPDVAGWERTGVSFTTDEHGAFAVYSVHGVSHVYLTVSKSGMQTTELSGVETGSAGTVVTLVAHRFGRVVARLLLDEGVRQGALVCELEHSAGKRSRTESPDGRVVFPRAVPGTSTFTVCAKRTRWVLARIEGVEVRRNEETQDGRLSPVDLRGTVVHHTLRLMDAAGNPLTRVGIRVESEAGVGGRLHPTSDGRVTFLAHRDMASVRLLPVGYEPRVVQLTGGEPQISFVRRD